MSLHHWFIPHRETHEKAKLLHWHFLIIYILLFILLKVGIDVVGFIKPGVLGVNSNITVSQVIEYTNKERQKAGLPLVTENTALDQAALKKAQNMFEENYWAHFSPTGKDPWGFITGSGYKFAYAGENLAKNFTTSEDVVSAWMASPSHRDNLLNGKYQDIGIAVVDGVLNGQKTTLVVQMFGRPYETAAAVPVPQVSLSGQQAAFSPEAGSSGQQILAAGKTPSILPAALDPIMLTKVAGISIFSLIAFLLLLDLIILRRRGVFRLSSHHIAHLSFLAIAGSSVALSHVGEIL